MALRVNKDNFKSQVLDASGLVLVEFYSDSCIPCKQMAPILSELEEEFEDKVKIFKVNVNFDDYLSSTYEVLASPTILFFQQGIERDRIRRVAKKAELVDKIHNLLQEER
jgi:thioredoxin 1